MLLILKKMLELSGELHPLNDGHSIINVAKMELDVNSKRKLADVIVSNRITCDNQSLMIDELIISKNGKSLLEEGQTSWIRQGDNYTLSVKGKTPVHFEAELKALVPLASDPQELVVCEIVLGNIELDLSECKTLDLDDDEVLYTNVPMTLYPHGYKAYSYRALV